MIEYILFRKQKIIRITDEKNPFIRFQGGAKKIKLILDNLQTLKHFIDNYDTIETIATVPEEASKVVK